MLYQYPKWCLSQEGTVWDFMFDVMQNSKGETEKEMKRYIKARDMLIDLEGSRTKMKISYCCFLDFLRFFGNFFWEKFTNQFLQAIKFRELANQVWNHHTILYSNDKLWFGFASIWDISCHLLPQRCQKNPQVSRVYLHGQVSLPCLSKSPLARDKLVSLDQQWYSVLISRDQVMVNIFSLTNRYMILLNQWHYLFRTCCCGVEKCSMSNSVRRQTQENLGLLFLIWNLERIYFTFCQGSIEQHII